MPQLLLLLLFITTSHSLPAETGNNSSTTSKGKDTVTVENRNSKIIVPVVFYQEETKVGAGLMGGYYFTKKRYDKVSNIQAMMILTQRKQVKISVLPKIYTNNLAYYFSGHIRASHYPDTYFGIGYENSDFEENFISREFSLLLQAQRVVYKSLMAGIQYSFDKGEVFDMDEGGNIFTHQPVGTSPYTTSGIGALATWDTRDNMFFATKGQFFKISSIFSSPVFGSSLSSARVTLDFRHFSEIHQDHIVAARFYSDLSWGDTPFQNLPYVGGNEILRGYYQGRYRDNTMAALIAEYRFPIYWRFRGTAFANIADVSHSVSKLNLKSAKATAGAGIRFKVNPAKMHIRFDVGVTMQGRPAIYFSANEAF